MNGINIFFAGVAMLAVVGMLTIFAPANTAVDATTGAATVSSNSTSTIVTHGLGNTPDRVLLSPTSDTDGKDFWVSASDAANFTLEINSTSTLDITFDWRAQEDE